MRSHLSSLEIPQNWRAMGKDDWLDLLLTEFIQPRLGIGKPCILSGYPSSQAALACEYILIIL